MRQAPVMHRERSSHPMHICRTQHGKLGVRDPGLGFYPVVMASLRRTATRRFPARVVQYVKTGRGSALPSETCCVPGPKVSGLGRYF